MIINRFSLLNCTIESLNLMDNNNKDLSVVERILSLNQKQILEIVHMQETLLHKLEVIFDYINACIMKYDFFTIQSSLKLVDDYLSQDITNRTNEINCFSVQSFPTIRLYLPQFNEKWLSYFNSRQLLHSLQ